MLLSAVFKGFLSLVAEIVSSKFKRSQRATDLSLSDQPARLIHVFHVSLPLEPGQSISLKCSATGRPLPQITWTRDGQLIHEHSNLRIGDFVTKDGFVNSYVNISSVHTSDGGNYQCTAGNDVNSVSHVDRIDVYGNPYVRPMANVSVIASRTLRIDCPVTGYPLEWIKWSKGDSLTLLPENHRQSVFANGTLIVKNVERAADEDKYRCAAGNKFGATAYSDVYVKILLAPVIIPLVAPPNLREGMRCILTCSVTEGDPPIRIEFYKDGRLLHSDDDIRIDRNNDFSTTLYISSVSYRHSANYTCKASNLAASTSYSVNMIVNGKKFKSPFNNSQIMHESLDLLFTQIQRTYSASFLI